MTHQQKRQEREVDVKTREEQRDEGKEGEPGRHVEEKGRKREEEEEKERNDERQRGRGWDGARAFILQAALLDDGLVLS